MCTEIATNSLQDNILALQSTRTTKISLNDYAENTLATTSHFPFQIERVLAQVLCLGMPHG